MTKEAIIEKTVKTLNILPSEKVEEIADFADFILKKHEEYILQKGIYKLTEDSETFNFLNEEEVLYSVKDIKKKINVERRYCSYPIPVYRSIW